MTTSSGFVVVGYLFIGEEGARLELAVGHDRKFLGGGRLQLQGGRSRPELTRGPKSKLE
jgi:hypothetical protein